MAKSGAKSSNTAKAAKKILVSQPRPESEKSPYFDLEKKYQVELVFIPFIKLEYPTLKT